MKKILLLTFMLCVFTLTSACSHHRKGHDHPHRKARSCGGECSSCDKVEYPSCSKAKAKGKECPYLKNKRKGQSCGISKSDCSCRK